MQREVMWSSWDGAGTEHLHLRVDDGGTAADGLIIGVAEGRPFRVRYEVRCDPRWRVRSVRVAEVGPEALTIDLLADGGGGWATRDGAAVPELEGCVDVDLSVTPFTNSLPIRRLGLSPKESADLSVAYVEVGKTRVRAAPQRYTRLESSSESELYRYESLGSGFTADLLVDGDGLVVDYPGLFSRAFSIGGTFRRGPGPKRGGRMAKKLGLVGVPTSMGAFAPGQEKGPGALRDADLLGRLSRVGIEVADHGDGGGVRRWRPDRGNRRAQNLPAVVEVASETAGRVGDAHAAGHLPLVVGGDCTIELGTVAGLLPSGESLGLLYFDVHPDLNMPSSVREGALDWMGVAHMLGEEGTAEPLGRFGPRFPLLGDEDVFLFSYGPEQATDHERGVIGHRGLRGTPVGEVASDPEGAATRALAQMEAGFDRLLVHFDVDTVDFTDLPLSENTGRNEGLPFDAAVRALGALLGSERLAAVTVTEFNPDHGEEDGSTAEALADGLARALSGSSALGRGTPTDP